MHTQQPYPHNHPTDTPQSNVKKAPLLTKKDVDAFYNLNQAYFDLDQLIHTQKQNNKDWQLDPSKMDQWVTRMRDAWPDLSEATQTQWRAYWVNSWMAPEEWKQYNAYDDALQAYKSKNILHLFAQAYKRQLTKNFVTWDTFKDRIEAVAKEAADKMKAQPWQHIFFLVPGGMEKSNPWIFFVFWKHLKDHIPNNATCHFISPPHTNDIYESAKSVTSLLQHNTSYQAHKQDALVFIFDDMSYSGTQLKQQLAQFDNHGYPQNFYILLPYITHRAKRKLTGMDPISVPQDYYDQAYINGTKPHTNDDNETETTWFPKAPVQFMTSTQVIQEILIQQGMLGSKEPTTTPTVLPFKIADNASIPSAIIYGSITATKDKLTQEEVNQFEPISLLANHAYTAQEKQKIRDAIFEQRQSHFILRPPLALPNSLLPIKAVYKNRTCTFQVKEGDTIVEKSYNNTQDLEGCGVFEAIKRKRYGQ